MTSDTLNFDPTAMGDALKRRIKQAKFESPMQEAMLNLMVASNYLRERIERAVTEHGVTLPQYNVLRILRGVHPEGHPRCEIAARMLDRAPDVTRIIDRLEEKKLVARDRTGADRRHSITRITDAGLQTLDQVDPRIRELFGELSDRFDDQQLTQLSRLCESLYESS